MESDFTIQILQTPTSNLNDIPEYMSNVAEIRAKLHLAKISLRFASRLTHSLRQKPILLAGLVDSLTFFQANALTIQALRIDRQSLIILVFDMWTSSF